jgi:hypothetical protein
LRNKWEKMFGILSGPYKRKQEEIGEKSYSGE